MSYPVARAPGPALSPALPPALAAMAAELVSMRRDIDLLKRGARQAQLASSSVEAGTITFNDASGNPAMMLGLQPDGTHALTGVSSTSDPSAPSDPQVTPALSSFAVTWDGTMQDGSLPLADFAYVQAEADAIFPPQPAGQPQPQPSSAVAQMSAAGTVALTGLLPGVTYQVYLTAFNTSGAAGDTSNIITTATAATVPGVVDGTTITGAQFVAFGGDGELLMYASDPSLGGQLVGSMSTVANTDQYGNAYIPGLITYTSGAVSSYVPLGTFVAQGWQNGQMLFATATSAGGPYTVASGSLRNIFGALSNGYSEGFDVNGTSDPATLTQLDARTIAMAGRIVTPSTGYVNRQTFASLSGTQFILPPTLVVEFPFVNAGGSATGSVILRPSGALALDSNNLVGNSFTICTSGTFRW